MTQGKTEEVIRRKCHSKVDKKPCCLQSTNPAGILSDSERWLIQANMHHSRVASHEKELAVSSSTTQLQKQELLLC